MRSTAHEKLSEISSLQVGLGFDPATISSAVMLIKLCLPLLKQLVA